MFDTAGNALDGESNATEPQGGPDFPTGDGAPGGSFTARFTVDSRPELGVWSAATAHIDTSGNYHWDPFDGDAVNLAITYKLGFSTDDIFAGNFGDRLRDADGFDKIATYGGREHSLHGTLLVAARRADWEQSCGQLESH